MEYYITKIRIAWMKRMFYSGKNAMRGRKVDTATERLKEYLIKGFTMDISKI